MAFFQLNQCTWQGVDRLEFQATFLETEVSEKKAISNPGAPHCFVSSNAAYRVKKERRESTLGLTPPCLQDWSWPDSISDSHASLHLTSYWKKKEFRCWPEGIQGKLWLIMGKKLYFLHFIHHLPLSFFFFNRSLLEYNCFTILC